MCPEPTTRLSTTCPSSRTLRIVADFCAATNSRLIRLIRRLAAPNAGINRQKFPAGPCCYRRFRASGFWPCRGRKLAQRRTWLFTKLVLFSTARPRVEAGGAGSDKDDARLTVQLDGPREPTFQEGSAIC
jgi:hypothetical protein